MAPRGSEGGKRLPRSRRLTTSGEIRSLLREGKRSRTAHLDVFDRSSPAAGPRVGLIVPLHRHLAVQRNVLKRRLREILRIDVLPFLISRGLPVDVLVRPRQEAYGSSFATLRDEILDWLSRRFSLADSSS